MLESFSLPLSRLLSLFTLITLLATLSCQDPTVLGGDLLDEDLKDVKVEDNVPIFATVTNSDSVRVYHPNSSLQLDRYWLGDYTDAVYGRVASDIYIQPRLPNSSNSLTTVRPQFRDSLMTIDSAYLVIPFFNSGGLIDYGNAQGPYQVEVTRVVEPLDREDVYFSNQEFATDPEVIGSHTFTYTHDSSSIVTYYNGLADTASIPYTRVPLSMSFVQGLVDQDQDTSFYTADSIFLNYLSGLHIKTTAPSGGLVATNMYSLAGGIYIHYTTHSGRKAVFQIPYRIGSVRTAHYTYDPTGSEVGMLLADNQPSDSILLLQGLEGPRVRIQLEDPAAFSGSIINKAELSVTVASISDTTEYPLPERLTAVYRQDDGSIALIEDAVTSNVQVSDALFGGTLHVNDDGSISYNMNITQHFQDVVSGKLPNELYIQVFPRADDPSRLRLFGPGHGSSPMKLKVYYTPVN